MNTEKHSKHLSIFIFIFFVSIYLLTAGGHFYYHDGFHKYLQTESMLKGTGPFHELFYTPGRDGKLANSFPFGTSFWMMPFFIVGLLMSKICNLLFQNFPLSDSIYFTSLFVMFLNSFATAASLVMLFRIGKQLGYSTRSAFYSVCLIGFTTMLWPYSKFDFSEPQGAFFLLTSFYFLQRLSSRRLKRYVIWSAIFFGLAFITKYEVCILFPSFIGYLMYLLRGENNRPRVAFFMYFFWIVILMASTVFAWNYWVFGEIMDFGRYNYFLETMTFPFALLLFFSLFAIWLFRRFKDDAKAKSFLRRFMPIVIGVVCVAVSVYIYLSRELLYYLDRLFLSSGKGLFLYSPTLILSFIFFPKFFNRHKSTALFVLSLFLLYLFVLRSDTVWGWGPRYYVLLIPFMCFSIFELVHELQTGKIVSILKKGAITGILLISLFVQLLAISVNYVDTLNYIDYLVANEVGVPIKGYSEELQHVFPRMMHLPGYSPLLIQYYVLEAVVKKKDVMEIKYLMQKPNVRFPQDWSIDFWWIYLLRRTVSSVCILFVVTVLSLTAMWSCFFLFRRTSNGEII